MKNELRLNEDRLFPSDPDQRSIARRIYSQVKSLPIISPHGHTDPQWFAENEPFRDPASLLVIPDHYVYRMQNSQGVPLESLGVPATDGRAVEQDSRRIWRLFAQNWFLFRGTPTQMWFHHVLHEVFQIRERLTPESADRIHDRIADCLACPEFLPRALFERFNIEVLATTESPLDPLRHHNKLRSSGWSGRVIPTYRPDPVTDPEFEGFPGNVKKLGEITGEDTAMWRGYLRALFDRRRFFASLGATATDHGHPTAATRDLSA
ncbi:MAG: glucuronate isomerase, partial [Acidobacteria bacterium]|nr:glucuronate isomerase [Acidobacteriota bacterium]